MAASTGIAIRAVVFALLELLGIFYILNVTIGICLGATISFILYDKIVFRRMADEKPSI